MENTIFIGKKGYDYTHFFFDGCHRFYLCYGRKDEMKDYGFSENETYPIELLPQFYYKSCPLRSLVKLNLQTVIPQFRKKISFFITKTNEKYYLDFEKGVMQIEFIYGQKSAWKH